MKHVFVGLAVAALGCGDNSKVCGDGTNDDNGDGICEPDGMGPICGDGTILDPITHDCQVDPSVCGDGTVLIDGECKDPSSGVDVDLLEGPEPNGFESNAAPAGIITLKSPPDGFVIKGCVGPLDNNTPDLDRYELTVAGPTLLHITADGVQGLAGGFAVLDASGNPLLASWFRLGINLSTDTSKREVFLPAAGKYNLVVTDSRTLFPITQGNPNLLAAGNPDNSTCYFVTITQRSLAPQALDLATGDSGQIGEQLKFYTAAFPAGFTALTAVIDPEDLDNDGIPDIDSRAASSIVVLNNVALRQVNDADANSPVSSAFVGGIGPSDDPLIVLDYVWNLAITPVDYSIDATATLDSQALPTIPTGTISAVTHGQDFNNGAFGNLNLFHWDVTGTNEVDGFDLTSSVQLSGVVADQDGFVVARLTGLGGDATSSTTFSTYKGLLRTALQGRYYFVTFAPRNPPGTPFSITSTIRPQSVTTFGIDDTPSETVNAFASSALIYDAGSEPWQRFTALGTGTGNVLVDLFDPATTFGRLDNLAIRTGGGAGVASTLPNNCPAGCDVDPLQRFSFVPNGSMQIGRILKNPVALVPPAVTNFLVKVNPTIASGTDFTLDFTARAYTDLGTLAVGSTTTLAGQTIDATNRERRYYLETQPNSVITITATPAAGFNAEIALIDTKEADVRVVDTSPNGAEVLQLAQAGGGFTAFKVRGGVATSTGGYALRVQVDPAFTYTTSPGTTAFADACIGGLPIALVDDGSGFGGRDDGLSALPGAMAPNGFTFFGTQAGRFRVSSNGFVTFDLAIPDSQPGNQALGAGSVNIAPYWDDLENVTVCRKLVGGKLVLQWTGDDFLAPVQFQAILDPTDDSIEFVYGPGHAGTGARATIGIQGNLGATQLGFDQAVVSPGSSKKLTPP